MHLFGAFTILRSFSRLIFRETCVAALAACLALVPQFLSAQAPGQWAWMGGSKTAPSDKALAGVYGTEYEFATTNLPGDRTSAATWVGKDGRLWLFGGIGFDSAGVSGYLNDLWAFDPILGEHGEWAWMGGSKNIPTCPSTYGACGQEGVYGAEYRFTATHVPGARRQAAAWTGTDGKLWLFGGEGYALAGIWGFLNDLWVFDPAQGAHGEWAWMGGNDTISPKLGWSGVYADEYQFDAADMPGSRVNSSFWTDKDGRFWLFAGHGVDSTGTWGELDDLWIFDSTQGAHGEWAWMGGGVKVPANMGQPADYGVEYQFASANTPGGRDSGIGWTDPDGHLWLMDGGAFASGYSAFVNDDLWVFDRTQGAHGEWAWMGGADKPPSLDQDDLFECEAMGICGTPGSYGAEYRYASANFPGSRKYAASWTGQDGKLWVLGGGGDDSTGTVGLLNDLWVFDPKQGARGEWAWIGGSKDVPYRGAGQPGTYGTEYRFDADSVPGGRRSAAFWVDADGNLWLFGGEGVPNDLWEYKIGAQSITFPQPASPVIYTVKPVALTAKASSGLAVSFASTTPKVCSVTDAKATLLATGSCTIEATQRGNASYIAAAPVSRTILVKPAGTVSTPTIKPGTGTYTVKRTVTITDSTTGAAIYYTVDRSTPSPTHGTRYEGAFTAGHSETVKAIAVKAGYLKSAIATSALTIQ